MRLWFQMSFLTTASKQSLWQLGCGSRARKCFYPPSNKQRTPEAVGKDLEHLLSNKTTHGSPEDMQTEPGEQVGAGTPGHTNTGCACQAVGRWSLENRDLQSLTFWRPGGQMCTMRPLLPKLSARCCILYPLPRRKQSALGRPFWILESTHTVFGCAALIPLLLI